MNIRIALPCLLALTLTAQAGSRPVKRRPVSQPGTMAGEVEDTAKTIPVRAGITGPPVVRAQILLDRARFSPGEIDGAYGEDLGIAIRGFQEAHGLTPTGTIDAEMWEILHADKRPLLVTYSITAADLKGPFQPIPKDVKQQAQMKWMGYESPEEELGEKFHLSPKLLAELNPGKSLKTVGEQITVPDVRRPPARLAIRVVISKSKRTVVPHGAGDKILAQYPATIGGSHDPLPIGHWTVVGIVRNPWFYWDPQHFWNANQNQAAEKLPPGPKNPVGVVWMGLSKEHFGIHGSPDPGHAGHGESYGCIRLTNWDAGDLSRMVRRGTPVIMEE